MPVSYHKYTGVDIMHRACLKLENQTVHFLQHRRWRIMSWYLQHDKAPKKA